MLHHIDHITYATKAENEKSEIEKWRILGLYEHVRLNTVIFPATHIALTKTTPHSIVIDGPKESTIPWDIMTGLSISDDPNSPVNKFIKYYGEGVQHIAYGVLGHINMDDFYKNLQNSEKLLTPVLTYHDSNGATLQQIFTAPKKPYGPFKEYVKRTSGRDGNLFNGFDVQNIENLYGAYDTYSKWLESK